MSEKALNHAKQLIHEIEQPGNDPTPRLVEIASILVDLVERLATRVDELEHGEIRQGDVRPGQRDANSVGNLRSW